LFSYGESVVYLNAEIAHRAFNLLVPQQKLHCPQVASAAVDEGRLGSAQRVRPKEARVQPNAGNPLADQPGILPRRDRSIPTATAAEEVLSRLSISPGRDRPGSLKARFVQPQRRFIEKDPRAAERPIIAALVQRVPSPNAAGSRCCRVSAAGRLC
jgi:hypothetical protein